MGGLSPHDFPLKSYFVVFFVDLNCSCLILQEDYPKMSTAFAGDRKFDVYMGIDSFGRNTYGGGKWDVCSQRHVFLWY